MGTQIHGSRLVCPDAIRNMVPKPHFGQVLKRRFMQAWSVLRHILSIRGLLQWLGLWKGMCAAMIPVALTIAGYLKHLAWPELIAIGLGSFAVIVVVWRAISLSRPLVQPAESTEPHLNHEAILRLCQINLKLAAYREVYRPLGIGARDSRPLPSEDVQRDISLLESEARLLTERLSRAGQSREC